ncbi:MAG: hypothetical protein NT031_08850, partial [Planctomycetota bacterium]|nr:hypothetical protein [Planctomycetota bacterium]
MRMRDLLAVLLLTGWLAGCENQPDWSKWQWPKKDKDASAGQSAPAAAPAMVDKSATRPAGETIDPNAIRINDRKVTVSDILKNADPELKKIDKPATEKEFLVKAKPLLIQNRNRLVAETLLYGAAERSMNDEARKHLDGEVKSAQERWLNEVNGDRKRLREELAKRGQTLDEALTRYRRGATIHLYLQDQLAPRVTITRDTLLQYYADHESDFRRPLQVQMQIIEAPFDAFESSPLSNPTAAEAQAAKDQARRTIADAASALARGEEFGVVATRFSRG